MRPLCLGARTTRINGIAIGCLIWRPRQSKRLNGGKIWRAVSLRYQDVIDRENDQSHRKITHLRSATVCSRLSVRQGGCISWRWGRHCGGRLNECDEQGGGGESIEREASKRAPSERRKPSRCYNVTISSLRKSTHILGSRFKVGEASLVGGRREPMHDVCIR